MRMGYKSDKDDDFLYRVKIEFINGQVKEVLLDALYFEQFIASVRSDSRFACIQNAIDEDAFVEYINLSQIVCIGAKREVKGYDG